VPKPRSSTLNQRRLTPIKFNAIHYAECSYVLASCWIWLLKIRVSVVRSAPAERDLPPAVRATLRSDILGEHRQTDHVPGQPTTLAGHVHDLLCNSLSLSCWRNSSIRSDETAGFLLDRRQRLLGLGALTGMALTQGFAASRSTIDLQVATALDLSAGLKAGTWSARELGRYYLGRIETLNGPFERFDDNGALNAFIRTYPDLARAAWERADEARSNSDWPGVPVPLHKLRDSDRNYSWLGSLSL